MKIYPVIMAGGSGTRLWPLSRELYPKQLLELTSDKTMLQDTISRLQDIEGIMPPIIICNENHRFMVAEQMRSMGVDPLSVILEPVGRNTAPAVAIGAVCSMSGGDDSLVLVLPADHFIENIGVFQSTVAAGAVFADKGFLITFGIVPQSPETGYGYIKKGEILDSGLHKIGINAVKVDKFVEKPDFETAKKYLESGEYFWNSGIFLFKSRVVLDELKKFTPEIFHASKEAFEKGKKDLDFFRLDSASFEACPSDSIDYAVMEKTEKAAMIPFDGGWNDLGSWEALWQVGKKDDNGNVILGDVLLHDVKNSYFHANKRLIAAVGMENHIVVETADAILISSRNKVQKVKKIVEILKKAKRSETISHTIHYAPWGTSETLIKSDRFEVKKVMVKPGMHLSLQKHFNRAEHWIMVKGTALVIRGDEEIILKEDNSTYIPPGMAHRLENPGKIPLELIEVRTGSYLEEDDILRLKEWYK